jgi:hypothetical protein
VAGGDTDAVLALYRHMHPGMNPAELLIEITTDFKGNPLCGYRT